MRNLLRTIQLHSISLAHGNEARARLEHTLDFLEFHQKTLCKKELLKEFRACLVNLIYAEYIVQTCVSYRFCVPMALEILTESLLLGHQEEMTD
jgi:hypothetical protein